MFSYRSAILLLLLLLGLSGPILAAEPHHTLVQLQLDTPGADDFLRANGGRLDILMVKPGSFAHIAAKPGDLEFLRASGLQVKILQTDMETENAYADKGPGYGIYHTWSETIAFVDSLHMLYPDIISEKWSIGQTLEGRDIWCFRISDNPEVDENEPEILFDAMHHCREIMASEFTIMFAEYLAQNYGTDPDIEVELKPQDYRSGRDPQMARALREVLKLVGKQKPTVPAFDPAPSRVPPRLPKS